MVGYWTVGAVDWVAVEALGTIVVVAILVAVVRSRRTRRRFYQSLKDRGRLIDWPTVKQNVLRGDGLLLLSAGTYMGVWYISAADGGDDSCPLPSITIEHDRDAIAAAYKRARSREASDWCEGHCTGDTSRAVLVDTSQSTVRHEISDLPIDRVRLVSSLDIDPIPPTDCA